MRGSEKRSDAESAFLRQLCQSSPSIQQAHKLSQEFLEMVRRRQGERLEDWITAASSSEMAPLAGFAKGLLSDLAAVQAGLSLAWSNGPTEGHVNRLKSVKRQGYGRAGFALLKCRVLHRSAA